MDMQYTDLDYIPASFWKIMFEEGIVKSCVHSRDNKKLFLTAGSTYSCEEISIISLPEPKNVRKTEVNQEDLLEGWQDGSAGKGSY